jgi:hypothetical protein
MMTKNSKNLRTTLGGMRSVTPNPSEDDEGNRPDQEIAESIDLVEVSRNAPGWTHRMGGKTFTALPDWKSFRITQAWRARIPLEEEHAELGRRVLIIKGNDRREVGQVGFIDGVTRGAAYYWVGYPSVHGKLVRVRKAAASVILMDDDVVVKSDNFGRLILRGRRDEEDTEE